MKSKIEFEKYFLNYGVIIPIVIIGVFILKQYLYFYEIDKYKNVTYGSVQFASESLRDMSLHYKYVIKDKEYFGNTSVRDFSKIKNNLICPNCKFKVYYSSKDPSKSSLRLGKYEEYKTSVEFGLFDD